MIGNKIKYPVDNAYPPDEQTSIAQLEDAGFSEVADAVVMRGRHDRGAIYILMTDELGEKKWIPVRID